MQTQNPAKPTMYPARGVQGILARGIRSGKKTQAVKQVKAIRSKFNKTGK